MNKKAENSIIKYFLKEIETIDKWKDITENDIDISYIKKGIHSGKDFSVDNESSNRAIGTVCSGIGTVLLGLAVYFIFKRKKAERKISIN